MSAGTLPAGITLNASTGVLAGTPTVGGTFSFTVTVTDSGSQTATKATSITIAAGALTITVPSSAALPDVAPGSTTSGPLGSVTVTDLRGIPTASWTATVTATTFVTGSGSPALNDPADPDHLLVGPATATSGTGTFTPGQANAAAAVNLTEPEDGVQLHHRQLRQLRVMEPHGGGLRARVGRGRHLHCHDHPLRQLTGAGHGTAVVPAGTLTVV